MNKFFYLIFLTLFYPNINLNKCSFYEGNITSIQRSRPNLDTSILSPTNHFLIHYDTTGNDAPDLSDNDLNGIPDYVDEIGIIADSSRKVLVDLMGYYPEPTDDDGIYDIFIQDMGPYFYGLTVFDDQNGQPAGPSYMLIDDEYEEDDYYIPGINTMRLTVAHEFFHAIQRAYRAYPTNTTRFLYEMSSTWIEDIIVPDGNDYLYWTDNFFESPDTDIDDTNGYSIALFGHYLTQVIEQEENQMSSSIIREIWEYFQNINNGHTSINNILNNYNNNFTQSWTNFCARNLYNGFFIDMNNSIYYYIDQIIAQPLTSQTSTSLLNQDQSINNISINNKSIAPLLSYNFLDFHTFNIRHSLNSNQFYGLACIVTDNFTNGAIINISNDTNLSFNENDILHLLYSGYDEQSLNVNLIFNSNLTKVYPNPFHYSINSNLNIKYEIPSETYVKLSIFDIVGRLVDVLVDEIQIGLDETYDLRWIPPNNLSSGIYFINLNTGNINKSEKLIILK